MERSVRDNIDGWDISLQRNVHMYCHALTVQKGESKYSIDCEDLPTNEKTIGVWLYNSKIPEKMLNELQKILLQWANKYAVKFQIYTSKDEFVTNKQSA
jgi:GH25 family lysozyme M1 (1,4-beta-N-acetylmuramidase)